MRKETPTKPPQPQLMNETKSRNGLILLLGLIVVTLWVQAVLRLWIAGEVLLQPTIENQFGAIVRWRGFDQFTGWIALAILAVAEGTEVNVPTKGFTYRILQFLLATGVVALTISLVWNETTGRAILDIIVASLLTLFAALLSWRQMRELSRAIGGKGEDPNIGRGLNVEQLWRGITLQWIFLWIAAELTLRLHFWREGVEAEQKAREFLFVLPVVGVMTNMMMAVGIKWWIALRGVGTQPRIRAWLVAIVLVNIGAACIAAGVRWGRAFSISGGILMGVGIGLYLIGFPTAAWSNTPIDSSPRNTSGGGKLVPLAFFLLLLGIGMMTSENFFPNEVPTLYSYAWRHLLASSQLVWLLGFGGIALKRLAPPRIIAGTRGVSLAGILLLTLGILAVAAIFLFAIHDHDTLRGLFVGEGLEAAGLVLIAMLFIRATLGMKK